MLGAPIPRFVVTSDRGRFLYGTHNPVNHVEYKNAKERGQRDKEKTDKEEKGAPKDKKKLQLTEKMNSIFMPDCNRD